MLTFLFIALVGRSEHQDQSAAKSSVGFVVTTALFLHKAPEAATFGTFILFKQLPDMERLTYIFVSNLENSQRMSHLSLTHSSTHYRLTRSHPLWRLSFPTSCSPRKLNLPPQSKPSNRSTTGLATSSSWLQVLYYTQRCFTFFQKYTWMGDTITIISTYMSFKRSHLQVTKNPPKM